MSLNFGGTGAFGSTATSAFGAKPTAFGAPITSTAATPSFGLGAATTGFGAATTGFGSTPAASSAFGATPATGFGAAPATNTGFGGFGFGSTPATTASTGFGLGTFGAPATSTPSTGFAFGATAPATGGFGFGTATPAAPATGFGGFGAAATSANTGFGAFGATATTASTGFGGFGGFGTTTSTAGGGLFGGGLGQTPAAGGFAGFGSSFGAKPATTFGLGGSTFGAPQQQQPPPIDPSAAFSESIFNCQVFGDERDEIIRRLNTLQALYGVGKGYYNQQAPPVDYDQNNPICRFKGIAYNARPTAENKDGCVKLEVNKKESELRPMEAQIQTSLSAVLGNRPNVSVTIEGIQALSETKSLIAISVQEKAANGATRKVPAQELAAFFGQPTQKQQLTNLQVENVIAQVEPTAEQIREYLESPPAGIDSQMWIQAQEENPHPDRLIPVPVVGFEQVRWRLKCQETRAGLQQALLDKVADELSELQRKHSATSANIAEYKLRLIDLQHRVLKVILLQEKSRKIGMSLMPEEEMLNSRLEALNAKINAPSFKNRLSTLSESVKSLTENDKDPLKYKLDATVVPDMKQFLNMSQSGISHMVDTMNSDLASIKNIKDGMSRILQRPVL